MPKHRIRSWALVAASLGLGLAQAEEAHASTFEVNPVRIELSQASSSTLLMVRNTSSETLRFQVSGYAWNQDINGAMQLAATQDIVYFPAMLSIKPGETRNVRVGTLSAFTAKEKSYRIFVSELPPSTGGSSNGIRVLTQFGVPVFLASTEPAKATPRVDHPVLDGRTLSFALKNDGNTHFLTKVVKILASSPSGGVLVEQQLPAWYVLAGGERDYKFELPPSACGATELVVSVDSGTTKVQSSVEVPKAMCTK